MVSLSLFYLDIDKYLHHCGKPQSLRPVLYCLCILAQSYIITSIKINTTFKACIPQVIPYSHFANELVKDICFLSTLALIKSFSPA